MVSNQPGKQSTVTPASRTGTIAGENTFSSPDADPPTVSTSSWPAMLFSLGLHLTLLIAVIWVASRATHGTGQAIDRAIGIAMVHRLPDRDEYSEAVAENPTPDEIESNQSNEAIAAAAAPPADFSPPLDLQGILSAIESTPAPTSGTGIVGDSPLRGEDFGDGTAPSNNRRPGLQTTAKVYGVSGSGSRFVYVFDRSDSMNGFGGLPLRSAKRELIRSLESMTPQQQFQIIFYNENVKPFQMTGSPLQMISGETSSLDRAKRYVESTRAFGGTKHKGALLMALRMSPDVIFFLTDANQPRLSSLELKTIQNRAQRIGTTIHAIEFGSQASGSRGSFLRDLAAMNNGQYQYVDIRRLAGMIEK